MFPDRITSEQHRRQSIFCGLEVACWTLVPKFAGSNPAEASRIFHGEKKILSTPSFGSEVKPSIQCRRFAWNVKEPKSSVNSILTGQIYWPFLAQ
jgi:hypothetical protein